VFDALVWFGDAERLPLPLGEVVQEWLRSPKASASRRYGERGLKTLRRMGSDAALHAIQGMAQRFAYKGGHNIALAALRTEAIARHLTLEQLEDRLVPTCGLSAGGTRVFDYGPRQITLGFDGNLEPVFREEQTRLGSRLPRGRNSDDDALVERSRTEWKTVQKQLGKLLQIQRRRLEQALVTARRWPVDEWREHLFGHPLLTVVVRRLAWAQYDGAELVGTFRIDETGDPADLEDDPYTLSAHPIGLPHPADLGDTALAWAEMFGDYEVIQRFDQFTRPLREPQAPGMYPWGDDGEQRIVGVEFLDLGSGSQMRLADVPARVLSECWSDADAVGG